MAQLAQPNDVPALATNHNALVSQTFMSFLDNVIPLIEQEVELFASGKLKMYRKQWLKITSDAWVLNTLKGADIELIGYPHQYKPPPPMHFSVQEESIIQSEIDKLLKKKVIIPTQKQEGDFVSNIFLRAKKDGTFRMILNLKRLNNDLNYQHFKMDCLNSALDQITKGCYMASIDLKDAYYSVPIAPRYWKFLKFAFKGQYYCFTCMPNGLSPAPRIFTKLLKPVFSSLRKLGYMSTVYIDDSLLIGASREECEANVMATVGTLREMGFTIHPIKSVFKPTQIIQYIGFTLNSNNVTVTLPNDKMQRIRQSCRDPLTSSHHTIKQVASVFYSVLLHVGLTLCIWTLG